MAADTANIRLTKQGPWSRRNPPSQKKGRGVSVWHDCNGFHANFLALLPLGRGAKLSWASCGGQIIDKTREPENQGTGQKGKETVQPVNRIVIGDGMEAVG